MSDYSAQVAAGLERAGWNVRVWSRELGRFTPGDLRRVGALLDAYPMPGRVLLQWVPHGFGWRSMNIEFCRWIAGRRDELQLMVHEPGLGFGEGRWRQTLPAAVHRVMLAILLRAASRVWIATEAWRGYVRPYMWGRKIPVEWLPVPSNVPAVAQGVPEIYEAGYFGAYDEATLAKLKTVLDLLPFPVLLLGRGSERMNHPRARPLGELTMAELSEAIASCRVMFHLYPDGVSGRRTTAMASLAHDRPVVTNDGRNTEGIWRKSGALVLTDGSSQAVARAIARLLADPPERARLGVAARILYRERFALERTIAALTEHAT